MKTGRFFVFLAAGLALLLLAVYRPALEAGFVNWDDDAHLLRNPFLEGCGLRTVKGLFSVTVNHIYIPLTLLSFLVERCLAGPAPWIYHLDNVLLHAGVSLLIWSVGIRCGLSRKGAGFGALLFALHPVHVESVAWVTERKDVLYAFFYMAAVRIYLGRPETDRKAPGWRRLLGVYLFGLAALLAKPMALSLPIILWGLDLRCGRRCGVRGWLEKAGLAALMAPIVWISYQAHMRIPLLEWPRSFWIAVWTAAFPLERFLHPGVPFLPLYPLPEPVGPGNPVYLLSFFVVVVAVLSAWRGRVRWFRFAFFWYVCSIFFLVRWDTAADTHITADRFMYLPSVGVCLALGAALEAWFRRVRSIGGRRLVVGTSGAVLVWLAVLTHGQCRIWRDGWTFWGYQRRHAPQTATALVSLKMAETRMEGEGAPYWPVPSCRNRERRTSSDLVVGYIGEALRIKPDYAQARYALGRFEAFTGHGPAARRAYLDALRDDPDHFLAWYGLGLEEACAGRLEAARRDWRRALSLRPDHRALRRRVEAALRDWSVPAGFITPLPLGRGKAPQPPR